MKKHMKIISILLILTLAFTCLPVQFTSNIQVYADDGDATELPDTDAEAVAADKLWLTDEYMWGIFTEWIQDDLDLPVIGPNLSSIQWSSSHPHLIDDEGRVNRPPYSGVNSYPVVLTATIEKGSASDTAEYAVWVAPSFGSLAVHLGLEDISGTGRINDLLTFNGTAKKGDPYISNAELFSLNRFEQAGSVFTKNKIQLAEDLSFSTYFIFDINSMYFNYDEGFTFTLQAEADTALGTGIPESLGVINVSPSLSVEFDTKRDSESADYEYQGPDAEHHIAVYANGDYQNPIAIAPAAIYQGDIRKFEANQKFKVWIQYDGTAKKLKVFEAYAGSEHDPEDPVISIDLELASLFRTPEGKIIQDVYAGFTGHGTQYAVNSCIYEWRFKNDPFPIAYDLPFSIPNLYKDASDVSLSAQTIDIANGYMSVMTAVIKDSLGNAVKGVPVTFKTDFGHLDASSKITDENGCVSVTLTSETTGTAWVRATAQGGAYKDAQVFLIETDEEKLNKDYDLLQADLLLNGNTALNFVRGDLHLPEQGEHGSSISWSSSNEAFLTSTGTVIRPPLEEGDQTVELTARLTNGAATREKKFTVIIKIPDADIVALDNAWLTDEEILNSNASWEQVVSSLFMPDTGYNGSIILWTSSLGDVISLDGVVTRPAYKNEPVSVDLQMTILMGDESVTRTFAVTVPPLDPTDWDLLWEAVDALEMVDLLKDNSDGGNILSDLELPLTGLHGSIIGWATSDADIIDATGKVTRPAFLKGDTAVALTATITVGEASTTKIFIFNVKEKEPTDEEAVNQVSQWLTADAIKGMNPSLTHVTQNLLLHTTVAYSAEIEWISDDPSIINEEGIVFRPSFSQGDKTVKLTAVIKRGAYSKSVDFDVIVVKLVANDEEAVIAAGSLLTYDAILGENTNAEWVIKPLTLPTMGAEGTSITWRSIPNGYISTNPESLGQLYPPSFTKGDVAVTLRATIRRGDMSLEKDFNIIVKALPLTDEEAVTLDSNAIKIADTLGYNPSPYAVTDNLYFSGTALYESAITYTSSDTDVLRIKPIAGSFIGEVIRPSAEDGHREVTVLVTVTKGSQRKVKEFNYTVLAEEDIIPPIPIGITPAHDSIDVAYNTRETVITFNENVYSKNDARSYSYRAKDLNITLNGSLISSDYSVRFSENKLIIANTYGYMPAGKNEIVIPAEEVVDKSGNSLAEDIRIAYTVEERVVRNVGIASSTPANGAVNVPIDTEISVTFDSSGIKKGSEFNRIAMMSEYSMSMPIACELVGNKLTVTLTYANAGMGLQKGRTYWLLIPGGAVYDRFNNANEAKLLSFVVAPDNPRPTIVSTYPAQNATNVSVMQHIQINFKDAVKRTGGQVRMTDASGQPVEFVMGDLRDFDTKIDLIPLKPLQPNTRYTVIISRDFVKSKIAPYEPASSDYVLTFTTGEDRLPIQSLTPELLAMDAAVNEPVRLVFDRPVQSGPNAYQLTMTDWEGKKVGTFITYSGNTAEIKPLSLWLEPYVTYELTLPAGVFVDGQGNRNDSLTLTFTTGKKLDINGEGSFAVLPSAKYLVDKKITFNTRELQETFRSVDRRLVSCQWNFGDGETATGFTVEHTYTQGDDYTVTLKATDNKGITYELEQTVSVRHLKPENVELIVTPENIQNLVRTDEYNDPLDILPGRRLYKVYVRNQGIYLPDEQVKVYLYKNGQKVRQLMTVNTQNLENGVPVGYLPFDYKNDSYLGNYELAFVYGDESVPESVHTVRRPINITDQRSKQNMFILPIHVVDGRYLNFSQFFLFEVDGVQYWGKRTEFEGYYYYLIEDVPTGYHSLRMVRHEGGAVYSDATDIWHTTTSDIQILPVYAISPGTPHVWAEYEVRGGTAEISSNMKDYTTFIYKKAPAEIIFNIDVDWNGTNPGIFEVQYNDRVIRVYEPWFVFYPYSLLPESRLLVRAINPWGEASPWVDCKIATVKSPEFPKVWFQYVNGEYEAQTDMILPDFKEGQIEELNDLPLLDHARSFGSMGDISTAFGTVKFINGKLYLDMSFSAAGAYGESENRPRMVTVGYNIEAKTGGRIYLVYDPVVGSWSLETGEFNVEGDVSVYREKGKVIPVIELGAKGRITIGTVMGGTLYIDNTPDAAHDYSGILYLQPYVKGEIYGGIKGLNVEGNVKGSMRVELHIPTGYIKVVPEVSSKIEKTILIVTTTVYDEKWSTSWDNGKKPVTPPRRLSIDGKTSGLEEDTTYEVIPRNYLRDSKWLASSSVEARLMAVEARISAADDNTVLKNNVYPYSEVQLVRKDDALVAVWTDDNPIRSDLNRTQLHTSTKTGSGWSEETRLDEDGTADFSPAVTLAGGDVIVAWQELNGIFNEGDISGNNLDGILRKAEISVTDKIDNQEDTGFLTEDDYYDHSPVIASMDETALLVWVKSDKTTNLDLPQGGEDTSHLMYAARIGGVWSEPRSLKDGMPLISDLSLIAGANSYLLLYTLDSDNDITTLEDHEIWARVYDVSAGTWGEPIRLTDNSVRDSNAQGVFHKGDWFILWNQDDRYVYRYGLSGETLTSDALNEVSGKTALAADDTFIALVYQKIGDDNSLNLSALFYDVQKELWSYEIPLITGPGYVRSFSPAFDADGNLCLLYTQADIIKEVIGEAEYFVPGNNVRLMFSVYAPKHDLAMDKDHALILASDNLYPGTTAPVTAIVENRGDFAELAKVALYEGTSELGEKIGEITQLIPARAAIPIIMEWVVPEGDRTEYSLYAVVKSVQGVAESDAANNDSQLTVFTSDIELLDVQWTSMAGYEYLIKPLIYNNGSTPLRNIRVELIHNEITVASTVIEELNPGEYANANFLITSEGFVKGQAGRYPMTVSVSLPEGIKEKSSANNTQSFELDTKIIRVEAMSHADGQTNVAVNEPIKLIFNRLIAEGDGFGSISFKDNHLNTVSIVAKIDENILTITPESPLQHSSRYTLDIPEDAIGDAYGRSMDKSVSFSFTTISQNPMPVFNTPFDQSGNVRTDTEIRIKYSDIIDAGPTFDAIRLKQESNNREIPVAKTIDAQWLILKPTRNLSGNTIYLVNVPMGAVKNAHEDYQSVNYGFTFTTEASAPVEEPDPGYGTQPPVADEPSLTPVVIDSLNLPEFTAQDGLYILDLTRKANGADGVRVTLAVGVLDQILADGRGLCIMTVHGQLTFPEQWIRDLNEGKKQSVTITIAGRIENQQPDDPSRVSGLLSVTVTIGGRPLIEFDDAVEMVMAVQQEDIQNSQRVIACRYDEITRKWVPLGGRVDNDAGTITFRTRHFSDFAAFEPIRSFDDVTASWAKEPVEILASRGLISGRTGGQFDPLGNITRAELTAMVIRSLYVKPATKTGRFSDVDLNAWYAENVETAAALGIISGTGNGRFAPLDNMTREQFAAIAYRLICYMQGNEPQLMADYGFLDQKSIASYAVNGVNYLAAHGIMVGSSGKFNPKAYLTRQEAAVVLYRLLQHLGEM